jgi:V/A-type H+-transporting ATPase subunit B
MDTMIQLFAAFSETEEKRAMGFKLSSWDRKLIKYGKLFEAKMTDLSVNMPLEKALDEGWQILATCFSKEEVGMRTELVQKYWPSTKN